jgi:hypothetical protein
VGHGAVPVFVIDEIYKPIPALGSVPLLVDQTRLSSRGGVYTHGYAVLSFEADTCSAEY